MTAAEAARSAEPAAPALASARRVWRTSAWRCSGPSRVAQPLFDLLKDNPEFFAARGSSGFDIIAFACCWWCCRRRCCSGSSCWSGSPAGARAAGAHLVFIGGLVGADRARRR